MKKLVIMGVLLCSAILLIGAQAGFAHPKKTINVAVEDCFNGIDDDGDSFVDCLDADCAGAQDVGCDTGLPGICGGGKVTCVDLAAQCVQNNQPVPEVCDDGIDNDCDGFIDAADSDCIQPPVEDCFNGIDDDGDSFVDCLDADCAGAQDVGCDTGLPGICGDGKVTCVDLAAQCVQNNQPVPEVCDDGIDNDCDGFIDAADSDCATEEDKVTICHIPRGNPARAHTITIDAESLSNHLAHGDTIGPCENSSKRHKKQPLIKTPKKAKRHPKGL